MKKIIYLILLFSITCYSQDTIDIQVEYQLFNDTYSPNTYFSTLYITDTKSIYHQKFSTRKDWDGSNGSQLSEGSITVPNKVIYDPYLQTDLLKKEMLFFSPIGQNNFLVRDSNYDQKWIVSEDHKVIAGYKCTKATTEYRGVKWIAWFAPEIPLPFGPWKLHGLPGLIFEAYDASKTYTMQAIKIEYKKSKITEKDFHELMKIKNNNPISYRQYLEDKDEYIDNFYRSRGQDQDVIIERRKAPRTGMEIKFEWEE